MTSREKTAPLPPPPSFAPIGQAVMESFSEGLVVFDSYGRVAYANQHALRLAGQDLVAQRAETLRPRLLTLGGRVSPLRSQGAMVGEAVFIPRPEQAQPRTLAERERQAIVDTLQGTHGRLAETARRLGISRTTLWRRLKAYGLRPGNGRPVAPPSRG